MAALNFPDSPIINQIFQGVILNWRWDGVVWSPIGDIGVNTLNENNVWTGTNTISTNGAASTPSLHLTGTIFTGGTTTTTKPILLIEPTGTTSNNWSAAGTLLGVNAPTGFSGNVMAFGRAGQINFYMSGSGLATFTGYVNSSAWLCPTNSGFLSLGATGDVKLNRDAAAAFQMGDDSATPVAQTFKGSDSRSGTDTNTVGGVLNIGAGRSTGNALPPELRLQTSEPTSSGSTAQTLTTRLAISGTAITASKPIVLPSYTVSTLPSGTVGMTAYVTDATAPTYLGALTGGGAVTCPVFFDGASWKSH